MIPKAVGWVLTMLFFHGVAWAAQRWGHTTYDHALIMVMSGAFARAIVDAWGTEDRVKALEDRR